MIGKFSLSLAMIMKNEAEVIARCLDSVKDVVDEIILVDTGSTDNTVEIAKRYTNKIYHFKWIDDFSAARNFSFDKCTGDFILWLDLDDCIYPEDAQKIKSLDLSDKELIVCNYEYAHDEFGNSICTVPRERIIKRSLGLKWEEPIHEYIPLKGKMFISDISIHHFKKGGTSERNINILKRIVEQRPEDSRNIYYLGKELLDFGHTEEGVAQLEEFVKRSDGFWEDIYTAHFLLAKIHMEKDENKFKYHFFESMKIEGRQAELYFTMGQYWERKGLFDRAIQWYEFCTVIERPKELLGTFHPEYYTWLPCLQLCVCYNSIGNLKKAYEWNQKAMDYRPEDPRMKHNKAVLEAAMFEEKVKKRKPGNGKRLNLGCGGKKEEGFVNVDLFPGPVVDEVFDLDEIPYQDNTISAINSEHSLEHVGWIRADKALAEWYRVLMPGGQLILKIPEFEDCCRKYLETPVENKTHRQWYKYTIYGIQKSQAGEPDEAQTHRAGWSAQEMCEKLKSLGFILDFCQKYDGWDTPSVALLFVKPVSSLKAGWIAPLNYEAAQTRIRVLHVNRWLRSRGYQTDVVNYTDIIRDNYDICIIGKGFDEHHYKNVKMLKQYGKTVIADLCEDIFQFPYVKEVIELCDLVVCCSRKLAEITKTVNPNVTVIEDAYET